MVCGLIAMAGCIPRSLNSHTDYETFGLLGEADEIFANFDNETFHGAGAPLGIFVGMRLSF